ncbi:MAG: 1-deoxy-D-xylulose-5-phosphate reductoisomerase, partial [Actinobacteria bacterium]|nr:1-deoxy-D-xylulose-5-phosphate reductoisomerase [Actinomycetota bacterium]
MTLKVALAGSTGSIGTQTLDVVAASHGRFEVVALAAASNETVLRTQIQ